MTDSVVIEFDPLVITKEEVENMLEKSGYNFVRTARQSLDALLSIHVSGILIKLQKITISGV